MSDSQKLLLKPEEVAERLSVGRTSVYDLLRSGRLESVRIGASRRVPAEAVEAFVKGLRDEEQH